MSESQTAKVRSGHRGHRISTDWPRGGRGPWIRKSHFLKCDVTDPFCSKSGLEHGNSQSEKRWEKDLESGMSVGKISKGVPMSGRPAIDLVGRRFSRLVVLGRVPSTGVQARFLCRCDCGAISEQNSGDLRRGKAMSCSCLRNEMTRARLEKWNQRRAEVAAETGGAPDRQTRCP
jgi:hypothetical protein